MVSSLTHLLDRARHSLKRKSLVGGISESMLAESTATLVNNDYDKSGCPGFTIEYSRPDPLVIARENGLVSAMVLKVVALSRGREDSLTIFLVSEIIR